MSAILPFAAHQPAGLLLLSGLPMPVWPTAWWAVLSAAMQPTEAEAAPELPYQPATEAPADAAAPLLPNSLRLGEYTIGETSCPALYGHPDIRY